MTVGDVRKILQGRLIARDARDGSIVFDTNTNLKEYIDKYDDVEVLDIWSEIKIKKNIGFGNAAEPAILIYIKHIRRNKEK